MVKAVGGSGKLAATIGNTEVKELVPILLAAATLKL
jgi:hypothetical protein